MARTKLTDIQKKSIIADYVETQNYSEVGRKYGITDVAGVINSRYEKEVSLVYSFKKDDKKIASQQFVDEQGLHDAGFVDGTCDLRNMIDNSYKVLINKNQKKKDKQKKKSK